MKTIKLIIEVSGYLKDDDRDSFERETADVSVECVKSLDDGALDFIKSCFHQTAMTALAKYYVKQEDYNRES